MFQDVIQAGQEINSPLYSCLPAIVIQACCLAECHIVNMASCHWWNALPRISLILFKVIYVIVVLLVQPFIPISCWTVKLPLTRILPVISMHRDSMNVKGAFAMQVPPSIHTSLMIIMDLLLVSTWNTCLPVRIEADYNGLYSFLPFLPFTVLAIEPLLRSLH